MSLELLSQEARVPLGIFRQPVVSDHERSSLIFG
jgi:hypothetical protein